MYFVYHCHPYIFLIFTKSFYYQFVSFLYFKILFVTFCDTFAVYYIRMVYVYSLSHNK